MWSMLTTTCHMPADEWLKLQLPSPRLLRIKDLHLEQLHSSLGEATDALEGYILLDKHWDLHGMLTSLQISFHRHFHIFGVSKRNPITASAIIASHRIAAVIASSHRIASQP